MKAQVQTWGNSLALRIPKSFAVESGIEQGTIVDVSVVEGKLVVAPVTAKKYTLKELLEGVTNTTSMVRSTRVHRSGRSRGELRTPT